MTDSDFSDFDEEIDCEDFNFVDLQTFINKNNQEYILQSISFDTFNIDWGKLTDIRSLEVDDCNLLKVSINLTS